MDPQEFRLEISTIPAQKLVCSGTLNQNHKNYLNLQILSLGGKNCLRFFFRLPWLTWYHKGEKVYDLCCSPPVLRTLARFSLAALMRSTCIVPLCLPVSSHASMPPCTHTLCVWVCAWVMIAYAALRPLRSRSLGQLSDRLCGRVNAMSCWTIWDGSTRDSHYGLSSWLIWVGTRMTSYTMLPPHPLPHIPSPSTTSTTHKPTHTDAHWSMHEKGHTSCHRACYSSPQEAATFGFIARIDCYWGWVGGINMWIMGKGKGG